MTNTLPIIHNIIAHPFFEEDSFEEQLNIIHSELTELFTNYKAVMFNHDSRFIIVSPSTKNQGYTQVTYLDAKMIPTCDVQCKTIEDILKELSGENLQILEIIE